MILATAALCLAANIFHEARGETIPGQYAVALVTMNRAGGDHRKVCDVVLARKQFSWTTRLMRGKELVKAGRPKDAWAWGRAQIVANMVLSGKFPDITQGATFYHASRVRPSWRLTLVQVKEVGRHIFYRRTA